MRSLRAFIILGALALAFSADAQTQFNVSDYAATSAADSTAAIDAAVSAARTAGGGHVYLPHGTYTVSHPIYIGQNTQVDGESRSSTTIAPASTFAGPVLVVGPDHAALGTGLAFTSAIAGSGTSALQQEGAGSAKRYVDLAQYGTARLPSAAWTVQFFYKPQDDATTILAWGGSLLGDPNSGGHGGDHDLGVGGAVSPTFLVLQKGVFTAGVLNMQFRYNGANGSYNVQTATYPTLTNGQTYFLEVSWDGSHIRAFINGELWTLGAKTPNAGVDSSGFVVLPWERMAIGNGTPDGPTPGAFGGYNGRGVLDSMRISNNVRHTANYTAPTSKQTSDSNTLLLVNFDQTYKDCLIAQNGTLSQTVYLRMTPAPPDYVEMPHVTIRNMTIIGGGGIVSEFASTESISDIYQLYGEGWSWLGNGYFSNFARIDLSAGTGAVGWNMSNASYIGMEDITVADPVGFHFDGANVFARNLVATMHPSAYVGLVARAGTVNIAGYQVDAEENSTNARAAVLLSDPLSFSCTACTLYLPNVSTGVANAAWAPVLYNHVHEPSTAAFVNPYFTFTPDAGSLVGLVGNLSTYDTPLLVTTSLNPNAAQLARTMSAVTSADLSSVQGPVGVRGPATFTGTVSAPTFDGGVLVPSGRHLAAAGFCDSRGATGTQTCNQMAGCATLPVGGSGLQINNSNATVASSPWVTQGTVDPSCWSIAAQADAGSVAYLPTTPCTNPVDFCWGLVPSN